MLAFAASAWLSAPAAADRAPVPVVVAHDDRAVPGDPVRSRLPSKEEHQRIVADMRWEGRGKPFTALAPMLMVVAFVSSLGNLVPYRGSDGAQLIELWRGRNRFARSRKARE